MFHRLRSHVLVLLAAGVLSGCALHEADAGEPGPPSPDGAGTGGGGGESLGDDGDALVGDANGDGVPAEANGVDAVCPQVELVGTRLGLGHPAANTWASAEYAREMLEQGRAPSPTRILSQEIVNYYQAPYAANAEIEVFADLAPVMGPDGELDHFVLQVAAAAPPAERGPMSFTVVLDVSGSMQAEGKKRQLAALGALDASLHDGDRVTMVAFADETQVLVDDVEVTEKTDLLASLGDYTPAGLSLVTPALRQAFELARKGVTTHPGLSHRIVLLTDGATQVEADDAELLRDLAKSADLEGLLVTAVNTGPGAGSESDLLRMVTLHGRGSAVYLDSEDEARAVFTDRFDEVMSVAARNLTFDVELPAGMELVVPPATPGGAGDVRRQHLAPGDAVVMQHELTVCSPDAVAMLGPIQVGAHFQLPGESTVTDRSVSLSASLTPDPEALARIAKVSALEAYADALRGPVPARIEASLATIAEARAAWPDDRDLEEIEAQLSLHPGRALE